MLHSKHSPNNAFFKANLKRNFSTPLVLPRTDKDGLSYIDEALELSSANNTNKTTASKGVLGAKVLPGSGFR